MYLCRDCAEKVGALPRPPAERGLWTYKTCSMCGHSTDCFKYRCEAWKDDIEEGDRVQWVMKGTLEHIVNHGTPKNPHLVAIVRTETAVGQGYMIPVELLEKVEKPTE